MHRNSFASIVFLLNLVSLYVNCIIVDIYSSDESNQDIFVTSMLKFNTIVKSCLSLLTLPVPVTTLEAQCIENTVTFIYHKVNFVVLFIGHV